MGNIKQNGHILPISLVFILISFAFIGAYFNWVQNKSYTLNYRIAKTKALFNAESGLAEKAFGNIVSRDLVTIDTVLAGRRLDNKPKKEWDQSMGAYRNVHLTQELDNIYQTMLFAKVHGTAHIKNSDGQMVEIIDSARISFDQESLAEYMYLTDSEKAGGHPFVFDNPFERRNVTFGVSDELGGGNIQSNGQFVMSDYGCPEFTHTVWLTQGQPLPSMGTCSYEQVFNGDPDTMTRPPVILPPSGYATLKAAANYKYDATTKLNWASHPMYRDTLIMTDIEFTPDGFHVKQWWFLKPPHYRANGGLYFFLDHYSNLEGSPDANQCLNASDHDNDGIDIETCVPYIDSLWAYHAKTIQVNSNGEFVGEQFIDPTISNSHGFAHFDYEPLNQYGNVDYNALLLDEFVYYHNPSVIYVMGGPVRVHGTYHGRYTVVTDEYILYHRHAAIPNSRAPVDTLWCNIWLTDDLVNEDAFGGSMANMQPNDECTQGSNNIMGIVSGANVLIANTWANGACNGSRSININAAIIAFNESFVMHYCQNYCNTFAPGSDPWGNPIRYSDPPYGDGRGRSICPGGGSATDYRGFVNLWGGVVQKYRGYMKRNFPGPYNTNDIGMDKNYHYDKNLTCGSPPFYPSIEFANNEKSVRLVSYGAF